ncbi:MAG: hypothetical protein IJO40_03625 [Thermoguttaceae bacterium]|jgi:hypothetical protein|nr:hypothetical protein [Thermoguttaceae bacterium]
MEEKDFVEKAKRDRASVASLFESMRLAEISLETQAAIFGDVLCGLLDSAPKLALGLSIDVLRFWGGPVYLQRLTALYSFSYRNVPVGFNYSPDVSREALRVVEEERRRLRQEMFAELTNDVAVSFGTRDGLKYRRATNSEIEAFYEALELHGKRFWRDEEWIRDDSKKFV